jgi:hypothetical protein
VSLFVAVSVSASEEFIDRSQTARDAFTASQRDWVDRATTGSAAVLYDGISTWPLVWTQLLWNDRITSVIDLPTAHVPGPLPQRQLQILANDGELRLVGGAIPDSPLLAAPNDFHFDGRRLVSAKPIRMSLWNLASPPRIRTWTQGLEPNGDLAQGGVATLDVFNCSRGTFHVVAIGRDNETLHLAKNGIPVTQTQLWPEGVWELTVKTPAAAGARCTYSLSTTSLVHLSVFAWTPTAA